MRERERENEPPPTPWGDYPLPSPKPYRPLIKSCLHLTAGNCSRQTLATAYNILRIQWPWFYPLDLTIFIRLPSSICLYPLAFIHWSSSAVCCHPILSFVHSLQSPVVIHVLRCSQLSFMSFVPILCPSLSFINYRFIQISWHESNL
jgi:hypothetical protein